MFVHFLSDHAFDNSCPLTVNMVMVLTLFICCRHLCCQSYTLSLNTFSRVPPRICCWMLPFVLCTKDFIYCLLYSVRRVLGLFDPLPGGAQRRALLACQRPERVSDQMRMTLEHGLPSLRFHDIRGVTAKKKTNYRWFIITCGLGPIIIFHTYQMSRVAHVVESTRAWPTNHPADCSV